MRLDRLKDLVPWGVAGRVKIFYVFPLLLLAVLGLVLSERAIVPVLVVLDIALGAFLKKSGLTTVGLELTTVTAFLAGMFFDPLAGFLVGALLYAVKAGIGGFFGVHLAWKIPGFGLFGAFAYSQLGISGAFGGLAVMRAVFFVLTLVFDTENAGNAFIYASSSLVLNFVLFTRVLPTLV